MPDKLADAPEPINGLWVGDGKSGKTTHAMDMARLGRVIAINAESGIKARALKTHGIPIKNIEVFPGEGEELTYEGLESLWLQAREELNKKPGSIAGFAIDSITELQQTLKDISVANSVKRAERRGVDRSSFVVDQDNWREVNEQCRSLIRKLRDLPCHLAITALERREQDKDGSVTYQPAVTPGLQNDLIGWMDVVCYTSVGVVGGEEEYRGLFRPINNRRGGDRFTMLPRQLVVPTFTRVREYIDGELTRDKDPVMLAAEKARKADEEEDKA